MDVNKKLRKMIVLLAGLVMVWAMSITAFAENENMHTVSTTSTTHTYEIYQIFTGTKNVTQLKNLKYGTAAKTGTTGASVSATDMAKLYNIEHTNYSTEQAKINALLPFVDLTKTPAGVIGKDNQSSVSLPEGYYMIKDKNESLEAPNTYTLYIFHVLYEDLSISPKDGTSTVDKDVTETADATGTLTQNQKGADYDQGDSIPYVIEMRLPQNITYYKTYTITLTDTLSEGLTPPAANAINIAFKDKDGTDIASTLGTPTATVNGQVITVTYTISGDATDTNVAVEAKPGSGKLANAVITVSYNAILNANAVTGSAGNPNTYKIEYSNNPNATTTSTTPEKKVYVYTYELEIEKQDGNSSPLQGADFTLYKKVTSTTNGAQTGAAIKQGIQDSRVNASKLSDTIYYIPVNMTQSVTQSGGKVMHKTDTKIDAGEYVLIETTVPDGYNAYEGMDITITSTIDANGALTGLTATPDTLTVGTGKNLISGTVQNVSGSVLPSTGGIGTKIFYIIGAILVIGAGVLLVTRRRVDSE